MTAGKRTSAWVQWLLPERRSGLRAFLRRRAHGLADPEDLAQEVYLRLLRAPDAEAIENPEAYLIAVAGNLVKERALVARRRGPHLPLEAIDYESQLATEDTNDLSIDAEIRDTRLRELIDELTPKCRASVVLHYRDGLSCAEAGLRLGISEHMVKKYIGQALAHFRRRLGSLR